MSAISGQDFLLEVESSPSVWVPVENFNAFSKKGTVPETFDPVFDQPTPLVSPGVLEETFTVGGFLDPTDPGQAVLRAGEANHTPVNVRYYKDGVQGDSQLVYVASFTHEAKPDGSLQTIVYELTALRPTVVPPPPMTVTAGLIGWYAADNLTTLQHNAPVQTFVDASGQGNHVTQATAANQPTFIEAQQNGRAVVRFDGVDDVMTRATGGLTGQVPHTIILAALCKVLTPTNHYQGVAGFGLGAANTSTVGVTDSGFEYVGGASDGNACGSSNIECRGAFHVFSKVALNDGSAQSILAYLDGVANPPDVGTVTVDLADAGLMIGTVGAGVANVFLGDLCEVLMYNRALTPSERHAVEQYLGTKWGIPVT
jgi:hypothetical protein